jgi:hypothetical protein
MGHVGNEAKPFPGRQRARCPTAGSVRWNGGEPIPEGVVGARALGAIETPGLRPDQAEREQVQALRTRSLLERLTAQVCRIAARVRSRRQVSLGFFSELFGQRSRDDSVTQPTVTTVPDEPDYAEPEDYNPLPVLTLHRWDYGQGLDDDTSGYGFVTPDGRIWPAGKCIQTRWEDLGVLALSVAGVTYHADDLADPGFDPGQPVRLVPEPDNPVDPQAIAVRNWAGDKHAGYIKKGTTRRLRNRLRGQEFRVMALACRYELDDAHRRSLKIVIFRPDRLLGAEHVPPHPPLEP